MPTNDSIKPSSTRVDPIRLELIKNALEMISDNMMVSVLRTSRSTLVKANMDF
ncbi:MAG: N-methylhydantoinase B/oxoprolinase/acetone carboxylase alpha subunit, partial [Gammaproteobacteria bacterium]